MVQKVGLYCYVVTILPKSNLQLINTSWKWLFFVMYVLLNAEFIFLDFSQWVFKRWRVLCEASGTCSLKFKCQSIKLFLQETIGDCVDTNFLNVSYWVCTSFMCAYIFSDGKFRDISIHFCLWIIFLDKILSILWSLLWIICASSTWKFLVTIFFTYNSVSTISTIVALLMFESPT